MVPGFNNYPFKVIYFACIIKLVREIRTGATISLDEFPSLFLHLNPHPNTATLRKDQNQHFDLIF